MLRPGLYRNRGAPWTRLDGTEIRSGQVFEPTEDERRRKQYKLEFVRATDTDPLPESVNVEDYAIGGNWYLVDGVKVQGRKAAEEALRGSDD